MAIKNLFVTAAVIGIVTATPAFAVQATDMTSAPPGTPQTKYCMHVEAPTGSRIEPVRCWTREEWAEQGVDVDRDWAKEGVTTLG